MTGFVLSDLELLHDKRIRSALIRLLQVRSSLRHPHITAFFNSTILPRDYSQEIGFYLGGKRRREGQVLAQRHVNDDCRKGHRQLKKEALPV